jgi:hypothetical protein
MHMHTYMDTWICTFMHTCMLHTLTMFWQTEFLPQLCLAVLHSSMSTHFCHMCLCECTYMYVNTYVCMPCSLTFIYVYTFLSYVFVWLYVYVYKCIRMYALQSYICPCLHACSDVYVHTNIHMYGLKSMPHYAFVCVRMWVCVCVYIYIYMRISTYMCMAWRGTFIHVCTCLYVYTYIHV